jgi:hypothetical protein
MPQKFWSDDFDMDLLMVFPGLPKHLGKTADVVLYTLGHTTWGRLNHPACWNTRLGLTAFFWLSAPNLERDKHGWVRLPHGCTTNEPIVECTWLELLRDGWVHQFAPVIEDRPLPSFGSLWSPFNRIMGSLRGYRPGDVAQERATCLATLMRMTRTIRIMLSVRQCMGVTTA